MSNKPSTYPPPPNSGPLGNFRMPPAVGGVITVDQNRAALDQVAPLLQAIPPDRVTRRFGTAARHVAGRVIDLVRTARGLDILKRLKELPTAQWDIACLNRTEQAARAVSHLCSQRDHAEALAADRRIDVALAEDAASTRRRMLTLCAYHFGDDSVLGPVLSDVARGTGYLDMADDLVRLATIYDERLEVVSKDPKHYRPGDAAHARQLADQIWAQLHTTQSSDVAHAIESQARAWTLLQEQYDQLRRAITFVCWDDPQTLEQFASLHGIGRQYEHRRADNRPTTEPPPPSSSALIR